MKKNYNMFDKNYSPMQSNEYGKMNYAARLKDAKARDDYKRYMMARRKEQIELLKQGSRTTAQFIRRTGSGSKKTAQFLKKTGSKLFKKKKIYKEQLI